MFKTDLIYDFESPSWSTKRRLGGPNSNELLSLVTGTCNRNKFQLVDENITRSKIKQFSAKECFMIIQFCAIYLNKGELNIRAENLQE